MKSKVASLLATGALLAAFCAPAKAVSFSYFLNESNELPDGVNYLKVTVSDILGGVDFLVEVLNPPLASGGSNYGIFQFGFNPLTTSGPVGFAFPTGTDFASDGAGNMNGYGNFAYRVKANMGNDSMTPLAFSVTGIDANAFGGLSPGSRSFAAHVIDLSAAGFSGSSAFFSGVTPVPEPGTWAMMIAGLIGIGAIARRRVRA